jgi:hypothetical protein
MNTNSKMRTADSDGLRLASAEERLKELGINLPSPPEPFGAYVEAVQTGNPLFLSGMLPTEGRAAKIIGRVGAELDLDAGRAKRPRCRPQTFGIARQSHPGRPARSVGGDIGQRCPGSTESRRRGFGVAARRIRKRQESLPSGVWRRQPSAGCAGRIGSHF